MCLNPGTNLLTPDVPYQRLYIFSLLTSYSLVLATRSGLKRTVVSRVPCQDYFQLYQFYDEEEKKKTSNLEIPEVGVQLPEW